MFWFISAFIILFLLMRLAPHLLSVDAKPTSVSMQLTSKADSERQKAFQFNALKAIIMQRGHQPHPQSSNDTKAVFDLKHDTLPIQLILQSHYTRPTLSFEGVLPPDALLAHCSISDGYHTQRVFELKEVSRAILLATGLEERLFRQGEAYKAVGCHLAGRHWKWRIELSERGMLEQALQEVEELQELLARSEPSWGDTLQSWCISLKRQEDAMRAAQYLLHHDPVRAQHLIETHEALNIWARIPVLQEMVRQGTRLTPEVLDTLADHLSSAQDTTPRLRLLALTLLFEAGHTDLLSTTQLRTMLGTIRSSIAADDADMIALMQRLVLDTSSRHHEPHLSAWLEDILMLPTERIEPALLHLLTAHSPQDNREVGSPQTVDEILHELFFEALHDKTFHDLTRRVRQLFSPRNQFHLKHYLLWKSIVRARSGWVQDDLDTLRCLAHILGKQLKYHARVSALLFEHLLPDSPHVEAIMGDLLERHPPNTPQRWNNYAVPLLDGYLSRESFVPLLEHLLIHCPDRETAHRILRQIDQDEPSLKLFFLHWVHASNTRRHEHLRELISLEDQPLAREEQYAVLTLLATPGHLAASYQLTMELLANRATPDAFVALEDLKEARHLEALKSAHDAMMETISQRLAMQGGKLSLVDDSNQGGLTLSTPSSTKH